MFENIDMSEVLAVLLILLVIGGQLLLCFKVKKLWIRLIPAVAALIATVAFFVIMLTLAEGWDVLGYLLLWVYSAVLLGADVIAWILFAIIRALKKPKKTA